MLEGGSIVLKVCMVGMKLAKEMWGEEDCSSFAWQTHDLKRRSREKQHTVLVEMNRD